MSKVGGSHHQDRTEMTKKGQDNQHEVEDARDHEKPAGTNYGIRRKKDQPIAQIGLSENGGWRG